MKRKTIKLIKLLQSKVCNLRVKQLKAQLITDISERESTLMDIYYSKVYCNTKIQALIMDYQLGRYLNFNSLMYQ